MVLPGFWDSVKGTYGQKPKDGGGREFGGSAWVARLVSLPFIHSQMNERTAICVRIDRRSK